MLNKITMFVEMIMMNIEQIKIGIYNGVDVLLMLTIFVCCSIAVRTVYRTVKRLFYIKVSIPKVSMPSFKMPSIKMPSLRRKAKETPAEDAATVAPEVTVTVERPITGHHPDAQPA